MRKQGTVAEERHGKDEKPVQTLASEACSDEALPHLFLYSTLDVRFCRVNVAELRVL